MSAANDDRPDALDCARVREFLLVAFDGELSEPQEDALERHLATCAACTRECDRLGDLHDALRALAETRLTPADVERHVATVRERLDPGVPFVDDEDDVARPKPAPAVAPPPPRPLPRFVLARAALRAGGVDVATVRSGSDHAGPRGGDGVARERVDAAREGTALPIARVALVAGLLATAAAFATWFTLALRTEEPAVPRLVGNGAEHASDPVASQRPGDHAPAPQGADPAALAASDGAHSSDSAPDASPDSPLETHVAGSDASPSTSDGAASSGLAPASSTPTIVRDDVRRLVVRAAIAEVVRAAGERAAATSAKVEDVVAEIDAGVAEWKAEGWPVARLVEPVVASTDVATATAALRWLGRRGDAWSAPVVGARLTDADLRLAALEALVDLRAAGEEILAGELRDEPAREYVLDALAARGATAQWSLLERASRRSSRALPVAVVLHEIGRRGIAPATAWVTSTALERGPQDPDLLVAAAGALTGIGDAAALRALLALRTSPRVEEVFVDTSLVVFFGTHADVVTAVASEAVAARRLDELRDLAEAMQDSPRPELVPAWLVLAGSSVVGRADRRLAVLRVGEMGSKEHIPALRAVHDACGRRERDVRVATWIAVRALGGRAAVETMFANWTAKNRTRALDLLDTAVDRRTSEDSLLDLARDLEPQLAPLHP